MTSGKRIYITISNTYMYDKSVDSNLLHETHLSRMNIPTLIHFTSSLSFKEGLMVLVGITFSNFTYFPFLEKILNCLYIGVVAIWVM